MFNFFENTIYFIYFKSKINSSEMQAVLHNLPDFKQF